jgi:hypothetical protein
MLFIFQYYKYIFHAGHDCHEDIIHSSSDGSTVDTEGPVIIIMNLGLFGMDNVTDDLLHTLNSDDPIYQSQYDSIDLRWNATDDTSDVANVTWMAGSMPGSDDKHAEVMTIDDQVRIYSSIDDIF